MMEQIAMKKVMWMDLSYESKFGECICMCYILFVSDRKGGVGERGW